MVKITDLSYLDPILDSSAICGSASAVSVTSEAVALGDEATTWTEATTRIKTLPNGMVKGKGRGTAIAIGETVMARVIPEGEGDIVIIKTKAKYFKNKNMLVARGSVKVIDFPSAKA